MATATITTTAESTTSNCNNVLTGTYRIVYQESNGVGNEPVFFLGTTEQSKTLQDGMLAIWMGKAELTFHNNSDNTATISTWEQDDDTKPRYWVPAGELTAGKELGQQLFEWRPSPHQTDNSLFQEYGRPKDDKAAFDTQHPERNFIEFTIHESLVSSSDKIDGHEWEFVSPETLTQLAATSCKRAHFHTTSPQQQQQEEEEEPREYDSFILCRQHDFDHVKDLLLASVKENY
ncbi:expressed unknown protein [Seminavis robusta]|uniref:Uncharacterized protein n=1 Tax=Seminavis robusta TaxID=568900 RepID=A0A9N8HES1_9STRA|nr:expressed unknown protein [Seminavis robusta]|eukprot:Sro398_g134660.1 n/a (233) ;mRNA; r:23116-23814